MNVIDMCFITMAFSSLLITYISFNESRKGHYFNVFFSLAVNIIVWLTYLALINFIGEVNLEHLAQRFHIGRLIERLVGGNYCYFFNMPEPSESESDVAYSSSFDSNDTDGFDDDIAIEEVGDLPDVVGENGIQEQLQNVIHNLNGMRGNVADVGDRYSDGNESGSESGASSVTMVETDSSTTEVDEAAE